MLYDDIILESSIMFFIIYDHITMTYDRCMILYHIMW